MTTLQSTQHTPEKQLLNDTSSYDTISQQPNEFLLAQQVKLDDNSKKLSPLPFELMDKIFRYTYFNDIEKVYSINSNIKSFAKSISLVNSEFYLLSLKYIYKYANFTRSTSFDKFLKNLLQNPYIGNYVQFLDFSEFTSVGLGRTGQMMQDIQMVTETTIMDCLSLTPNLREFLACESIQNDLNHQIINYLFNTLTKLESLDFTGCNGYNFVQSFKNLKLNENYSLKKLSFHDCTDLNHEFYIELLKNLKNLERLDLMHTLITTKILTSLNENSRLTHLSMARCSRLGTTRELIEFLTKHPTVSNGSLRWLNLEVDTNIASPFNQHTLSFLLRNMNAPRLRYLNLSGIEVNFKHLELIVEKFEKMESLVLAHSQISIDELIQFLKLCKNLKFIGLTGNKNITRWSLDNYKLLTACPTLLAIEVDYKVCEVLDETSKKLKIFNSETNNIEIWKSFNNSGQGRRAWIFKLNDEQLKKELKGQPLNFNNNIIYFDINTGEKIFQKIKFPTFLKYASRKINCSKGLFKSIEINTFPVDFSERGLYKYYSLNK
ncbi:hypothetical protein CANARDRAFT_194302 [[Candida] arabinofermentans NRRL YB-2248]|uniref:Uncharacterized protein n=1 Tax=[Candida] arabinofermentans NRRL YB-2248 TaxID=983967 RepID=A0A1E4T6A3_9ASCO|nr:hypothetical protein CANARDRAFT_194302 [[Candida] arabinofermentans NRRL YB-2248]